MSPTARTLAFLREAGILAGVVERWLPQARVRKDLFGCIDIITIQGAQIVGIQATSGSNHAARIAKAIAVPELKAWLGASATFEVWSWSKRVGRKVDGSKSKIPRWQARVQQITLDAKGRPEAIPSHYPTMKGVS